MRRRRPPHVAIALLERLVPDNTPLAGDLLEEFELGRSRLWIWWQVLGAVVFSWLEHPVEIRPLRLVDLQPADAIERSRRLTGRFRPVNLSASPVTDVGGIGLVVLAFLVTNVMPLAWWMVLASILAGIAAGAVRIALHARSPYGSMPPSICG